VLSRTSRRRYVTWELTRKEAGRDFFAAHTVSELAGWSDYDLEDAGRLSEPMRYDEASDRYVPVSWEEAFELAGRTLQALGSPHEAPFYTSGRLSNEATLSACPRARLPDAVRSRRIRLRPASRRR
jgi:anaerobic selenocysteine-containing dehydrogenase